MFTIKIHNDDSNSTILKSWPSVRVEVRDSECFNSAVAEEYTKLEDAEASDEDKEALNEAIGMYSAILVCDDTQDFYFLIDHEKLFITDSGGNTVYMKKC